MKYNIDIGEMKNPVSRQGHSKSDRGAICGLNQIVVTLLLLENVNNQTLLKR